RDFHVTGVQTCALPISGALGFQLLVFAGRQACRPDLLDLVPQEILAPCPLPLPLFEAGDLTAQPGALGGEAAHLPPQGLQGLPEIGRASCRESVEIWLG